MKINLKTFLLIVISVVFVASQESKVSNSLEPNTTAENIICKKCNCDAKTKIIDCSNKSLTKMFTVEEWAVLNATSDDYETLKLDHNQLTNIDVTFPALRFALTYIDLRHNKINQIVNNVFTNLTYLEEVDLSFNELTSDELKPKIFEGKFSPDYSNSTILKRLSLSYNLLQDLNPMIFEHTKNLQELYLDNNPFQTVHTSVVQAFAHLQQLHHLDMSYMELSSLPDDVFHPLKALKCLKLDGNMFKTIPKALKFATNVRELSLNENPIGDLNEENSLPEMLKLEKLNMTFMGSLKVIGKGSFKRLESLTELRLSNNHHLQYIHPDAFTFGQKDNPELIQYPLIKRLYLNNNNLSTLDSATFPYYSEMDEIHIHDNPWLCDCELQHFLTSVIPIVEKTSPHLIENIKCASPQSLKGKKLVDMSHSKIGFRCLDSVKQQKSEEFEGISEVSDPTTKSFHKRKWYLKRNICYLVTFLVGILFGILIAYLLFMAFKIRATKKRAASELSGSSYKRVSSLDNIHC